MRIVLLFLLSFFISAHAAEPLDTDLAQHIRFEASGTNTVGWITIEDHSSEITQATWLYVKNALDYYKKQKPIFIVLELNTPGGEVFAAQKISDALKEMDTQYGVPVVTYVNNWAISAGAMLAYSTRYIAVAKDASMGAAEPLTVSEAGKTETASEKVNSALRADFANRAAFFGRNPLIAEAMVDKDMILVWRNGKVVKLEKPEEIQATDEVISPKGKLLTLTSEEMMRFHVADMLFPPTRLELIAESEKTMARWPLKKTAFSTYPFFANIPNAVVDVYQMDWKTQFFAFLAKPVVSSLLFLGMMLGFYIEINTPGFGVAGTLALGCLFLIALSSFSLEIANWLELIFLFAGLMIILLEIFVLPTFGILGFIGILLFLAGLFGMMLPGIGAVDFEFDTNTLNAAGQAFFERLAWLSGTLVVGLLLIVLLARFFTPNLRLFKRFVLEGSEQTGYIAGASPTTLPQPGTLGEAASTLRPSGKVLINGSYYDAITQGHFIEMGEKVVVSALDGSVIIVEKPEHS